LYISADIEKAFDDVFFEIEKLIEAQILKATKKGLAVTVRTLLYSFKSRGLKV